MQNIIGRGTKWKNFWRLRPMSIWFWALSRKNKGKSHRNDNHKMKASAGCTAAPTVRYGGFGVLPNKQKPDGFLFGENRPVCRKGTTRHCLLRLPWHKKLPESLQNAGFYAVVWWCSAHSRLRAATFVPTISKFYYWCRCCPSASVIPTIYM